MERINYLEQIKQERSRTSAHKGYPVPKKKMINGELLVGNFAGGGKDREEMSESEYYGWIFVEEKLPPLGENVLIAYVDEDVNGEKFVDYMVTRYDKYKIIYTEETKWFLPPYSNQSCVKAWRKLPPFPLN